MMLTSQILIVDCGFYSHWAIPTNRLVGSKPSLISNSARVGNVAEESWEDVVQGRPFELIEMQSVRSHQVIVAVARSLIGKVPYNFLTNNCEHFVRSLVTGKYESKQVLKFAIASVVIALAIAAFARAK